MPPLNQKNEKKGVALGPVWRKGGLWPRAALWPRPPKRTGKWEAFRTPAEQVSPATTWRPPPRTGYSGVGGLKGTTGGIYTHGQLSSHRPCQWTRTRQDTNQCQFHCTLSHQTIRVRNPCLFLYRKSNIQYIAKTNGNECPLSCTGWQKVTYILSTLHHGKNNESILHKYIVSVSWKLRFHSY